MILLIAACGLLSIAIVFWLASVIDERWPHTDILGDRETRQQERLAYHRLHPPSGNVQASPIMPPVKQKCSRTNCVQPVFLSGLCPAHFEQFADWSYEYSWEQRRDF